MRKADIFLGAIAAVGFILAFDAALAEGPDPLALPCTIGAITQATNPYSKKVETYKCEKCGSETCWIMQPSK